MNIVGAAALSPPPPPCAVDMENHSLLRSSEEEEENGLDFLDEFDSNSSTTTTTPTPPPPLPDPEVGPPPPPPLDQEDVNLVPICVPPPSLEVKDEECDDPGREEKTELPQKISNLTLKPETAAAPPAKKSRPVPRGRIEIVRRIIRKFFCKICMAEVPSIEGLKVHLDRQHKIRVKGAPRIADVEHLEEEKEEQTALSQVSDLIKASGAQSRTTEPLPASKPEPESDPWSDSDDYDDFHSLADVSSSYPSMKEAVSAAMTRREARRTLKIQEEQEKPDFLQKLEGYTQCSSCRMEFSLDPRSVLLREEHERLHANGSYKECPHCAMPFLYHAQMEEHLQDLSVPTIPSDLFEEEGLDVLYESHPCEREGCGASFKNRRCLLFHTTLKHDFLHRCPVCEKPFVFYSELRSHIEQRHDSEKRLLPCPLPHCGRGFETKKALHAHITHGHLKLKGKKITQFDAPHHHPPQSFWRRMASNLGKEGGTRVKKERNGNSARPLPPPLLAPSQVKKATTSHLHSLPPRPNVLTHPTLRFVSTNSSFPKFCHLCSRRFRTLADRDEHLRRTHGLDLTLPKPYLCPEPHCTFANNIGGRLIMHIRFKHPGTEDALLRRSLAEDTAAEGGAGGGESGGGGGAQAQPNVNVNTSILRPGLEIYLKQFRIRGGGAGFICPACPQRTFKFTRSLLLHLKQSHPDSPHLYPDTAVGDGVAVVQSSSSKKVVVVSQKRRTQYWKRQFQRKTRLLQRTGVKRKPPPTRKQSQVKVKVEPGSEEEEEFELEVAPPPVHQGKDDDADESIEEPGSVPPFPNLLLLPPPARFAMRKPFTHVCTLCSRSFRNKEDRAAHYSGTHGLNLIRPRPLRCPWKGCVFASTTEKPRLMFHLRLKHPPSVEDDLIRKSLAEDAAAAAEGVGEVLLPPPPESESEEEEEDFEVAPPPPPRSRPPPSLQGRDRYRSSLPPRPSLLHVPLKARFRARYGFCYVCSLCSRAFRKREDRATHYSGTHGLDLTLPRPLLCSVEGCGFSTVTDGAAGKFLYHLRVKHPPAVEDALIRKSLAEDAAAEGVPEGGADQPPSTPPPPEESGSEEEYEVAPPFSPLDDDEAVAVVEDERNAPGHGQSSLPPRPNLLRLPPLTRFRCGTSTFSKVCPLCSRRFRTTVDRSAHFTGTHGLDLTLPHPLLCPVEGCGFTAAVIGGQFRQHLRDKHSPSAENDFIRKSLAEDAAGEGKVEEPPPPEESESESEEEFEVAPPPPPPVLHLHSGKEKTGPGERKSLPPRPSLLHLPHKDRFSKWSNACPNVCTLCSRSFRNKSDRSTHYADTHGLDLTLPRPLLCPVEGCAFVSVLENPRLLFHLRASHPPSEEDALIRKSLAEDAAVDGKQRQPKKSTGCNPPPPPPKKSRGLFRKFPTLGNKKSAAAMAFLSEAGLLGRTDPARITCPLCSREGKREKVFADYSGLVLHLHNGCSTWEQRNSNSTPSDESESSKISPPPPPPPKQKRRGGVVVRRSELKHKITLTQAVALSRKVLAPPAPPPSTIRSFGPYFDQRAVSDLTRWGLLERISSTRITCPLCPSPAKEEGKYVFPTLHHLWRHLQRSCAEFRGLYPGEKVISRQGERGGLEEWPCGWCSSTYQVPQSLVRHMTKVHAVSVPLPQREAHYAQLKTCSSCGGRKKGPGDEGHVCKGAKGKGTKIRPAKKRKRAWDEESDDESEEESEGSEQEEEWIPTRTSKRRNVIKIESPENEEELKRASVRLARVERRPSLRDVDADSDSSDSEEEASSSSFPCSTCGRSFMSLNSLWAHEKAYKKMGRVCSSAGTGSSAAASAGGGGGGQPRRKKAKLEEDEEVEVEDFDPPPPELHPEEPFLVDLDDHAPPSPSAYDDAGEDQVMGTKCEYCEDWFPSEGEKYTHTLQNHLEVFMYNT